MSDDDIELDASSAAQRRTLLQVLLLNAGLSAALFITGGIANSAALIANGADNASDAVVYALSFFAATHGARWKVRAARLSGIALLMVAAGVFIEALRRFFGEPEPAGPLIIAMSLVAAAVNILCLRLLLAHRRGDVNLRAAWTFSINDMLSNLGALAAGVLVMWLGRAWPDLIIGMAIAFVAAKGGWEILEDAHRTAKQQSDARAS